MKNLNGIDIPEQCIKTLAYLVVKYAIIEAKKAQEEKEEI